MSWQPSTTATSTSTGVSAVSSSQVSSSSGAIMDDTPLRPAPIAAPAPSGHGGDAPLPAVTARAEDIELLQDYVNERLHRLYIQARDDINSRLIATKQQQHDRINNQLNELQRQHNLQIASLTDELNRTKSVCHQQRTALDRMIRSKAAMLDNVIGSKFARKDLQVQASLFRRWRRIKDQSKKQDREEGDRWAAPFARRKFLLKIMGAWRSQARAQRRQSEDRLWREQLEGMTRQLVTKYENELSGVREQLAQTNVMLRFHQSQQNMLEEKMKQAFLRGVCALNREAMGVFHEDQLPSSIRHAVPSPPYMNAAINNQYTRGDDDDHGHDSLAIATASLPVPSPTPLPSAMISSSSSSSALPSTPSSSSSTSSTVAASSQLSTSHVHVPSVTFANANTNRGPSLSLSSSINGNRRGSSIASTGTTGTRASSSSSLSSSVRVLGQSNNRMRHATVSTTTTSMSRSRVATTATGVDIMDDDERPRTELPQPRRSLASASVLPPPSVRAF